MTITLQLTAFRARPQPEQRSISSTYFRAIGHVHSIVVRRILDDIGTALTSSVANTVAIDISGATTDDMAAVCALLSSAGQLAPLETPPDWLRKFIQDAEAGSATLVKRRRFDGQPPA